MESFHHHSKSTERTVIAARADVARTTPTTAHRRHLRTRVEHLLVKIRVGNGAVIAPVDDISLGGFFAATQKVIPFGAFIELSLLCAGGEEICVGGVIVDDAERRRGLAVRFEAVSLEAGQQLRRVVEQQHERDGRSDPDHGVARARVMRASGGETQREDELAALRLQVALLITDNKRLRAEAAGKAEAEQLVGRLRIELERQQARDVVVGAVDPAVLADIQRDADTAWTAIARVTDAVAALQPRL